MAELETANKRITFLPSGPMWLSLDDSRRSNVASSHGLLTTFASFWHRCAKQLLNFSNSVCAFSISLSNLVLYLATDRKRNLSIGMQRFSGFSHAFTFVVFPFGGEYDVKSVQLGPVHDLYDMPHVVVFQL